MLAIGGEKQTIDNETAIKLVPGLLLTLDKSSTRWLGQCIYWIYTF
jgi:hypothetical protein